MRTDSSTDSFNTPYVRYQQGGLFHQRSSDSLSDTSETSDSWCGRHVLQMASRNLCSGVQVIGSLFRRYFADGPYQGYELREPHLYRQPLLGEEPIASSTEVERVASFLATEPKAPLLEPVSTTSPSAIAYTLEKRCGKIKVCFQKGRNGQVNINMNLKSWDPIRFEFIGYRDTSQGLFEALSDSPSIPQPFKGVLDFHFTDSRYDLLDSLSLSREEAHDDVKEEEVNSEDEETLVQAGQEKVESYNKNERLQAREKVVIEHLLPVILQHLSVSQLSEKSEFLNHAYFTLVPPKDLSGDTKPLLVFYHRDSSTACENTGLITPFYISEKGEALGLTETVISEMILYQSNTSFGVNEESRLVLIFNASVPKGLTGSSLYASCVGLP